jgi:threonyl-tRNA synthetase
MLDLSTLRHSTAHLMAQAIKEVYPHEKISLGVGPVLDYGFFYDIEINFSIKEEDFSIIEDKMKEIIKRNDTIELHQVTKEEALKVFADEPFKKELIEEINEDLTYYSQNTFKDLCRGPHLKSTGSIYPYFKILKIAGAYWKGDESRPMLQRIYAACFESQEALEFYLQAQEQAKLKDHRELGKKMNLFLFDDAAPASPFFLPKGAIIYNELIQYLRRIYKYYGYQEVITPQVLDTDLWKTSGHYEHYKENMYFLESDKKDYALKPMNCPCHMIIFQHGHYSYKQLPLKISDFGRVHRYERSGAVSGLTRVRSFCQDDGHVFLDPKYAGEEIKKILEMYFKVYDHLGFKDIKIHLSTKPKKDFMGSDDNWDQAMDVLKEVLKDKNAFLKEGDGAFYGPKIDIEIADASRRYHQLGTIQLDFFLPERFDLSFIDEHNQKVRPVVIHKALLGSLERFIGVYLEHTEGILPFWLAPEQVMFIPLKQDHVTYCESLIKEWNHLRCVLDSREETLNLRIRQSQTNKIPITIVVGDKELQNDQFTLKIYGQKETMTLSKVELLHFLETKNREKYLE